MKSQTLPVKRRPVTKGIFRRLSAVTYSRKQRVAAASNAEMDMDDGGSKISRALVIIFLIHIVAIGMIFIHLRFLDGRVVKSPQLTPPTVAQEKPAAAPVSTPMPASGEKAYVVKPGDNYARIAAAEGVDEGELRLLNKHANITPSLILKIPPKHSVAATPPAVTTTREKTPAEHKRGLVEAIPVDVSGAPKARLVSSNGNREAANHATPATATGKSYVVQSGDNIWRIAKRCKVSQEALLRANNISDARKIQPGTKLVIPQNSNTKS